MLTWAVILSAVVALTVAVLVPRLGGATPYTVLTGSMRPELPPGTLVAAKPTPFEELAIGDVVTYQIESGRPTVVTHRVVGIGISVDGERVLTTQGDANEVVDPRPVREVQVKGRLWYSVPILGRVNGVISGHQHQIAVYIVAGLCVGYAAAMFGASLRDRASRKREAA